MIHERYHYSYEHFGGEMRSDVMIPGEVEGTDYLLSSTMRLEDTFFQMLGEFLFIF